MSVDKKEVEDQIAALGIKTDWTQWHTKAARNCLPEIIMPGEKIYAMTTGHFSGIGVWLVAVTDRRVLLLEASPPLRQIQFPLSRIGAVSCKAGLIFGEVLIPIDSGQHVITQIRTKDAKKVAQVISDLISRTRQPATITTADSRSGVISQIRQTAALKQSDVEPTFALQDEKAIERLSRDRQWWFEETFLAKDTQAAVVDKMRAMGQRAMEEGIGRKELARELEANLKRYFSRDYPDWELQAASMLVRARSVSALQSFSDAGFVTYQWIAVRDERTCPICEALDGQEWNVDKALRHSEEELSLTDPEDLKYHSPWIYPEMKDGKWTGKGIIYKRPTKKIQKVNTQIVDLDSHVLADMGVHRPPCHALCRCVLIAGKF